MGKSNLYLASSTHYELSMNSVDELTSDVSFHFIFGLIRV